VIPLNDTEKERQVDSEKLPDKAVKGLYGLEPDMSLQSVNFAPNENPFLNEHGEEVEKND
jgi:hypothetical protein